MSRKCEGPDQLRVLIEVFVVHLLFQHLVQIDLHTHWECRCMYIWVQRFIRVSICIYTYCTLILELYMCVCLSVYILPVRVFFVCVCPCVCVCRRVYKYISGWGCLCAQIFCVQMCPKGLGRWNTWESSRFGIVKALKAFNSFILLLLLPANPLADNVTHGWSANGCHGWISLNRCQKDFKHMYTFAAFLLPINHNKSCSHEIFKQYSKSTKLEALRKDLEKRHLPHQTKWTSAYEESDPSYADMHLSEHNLPVSELYPWHQVEFK